MTDYQEQDSANDYDILQPRTEKLRRRRRRSRMSKIRRRLRKIRWHYVALFAVTVTALFVVGVLVIATDAQNRINTSWQSLARVLESVMTTPGTELTLTDFERLQSSLDEMNGTLSRANNQTRLLRPATALIPEYGVTFGLLDATEQAIQAAQNILLGAKPMLFFLAGGDVEEGVVVQASSGERVVELLELGRGEFLAAQQKLNEAQTILDDLSLAAVSADTLLLVRDLNDYLDQLQQINHTSLDAPALLTIALGLDGTQSYLVLAQNSDELRPSGGYISTYGWLQIRNGRIFDYDYHATTATTPNPPPTDRAEETELPDWWIHYGEPIYAAWDGSWYADFPATAQLSTWYYTAGDNPHAPVDGVIAIDMIGFEYILATLGSVVVPGYDEVVTAENFREVVYRVRAERETTLAHKRFVAALYKQILSDWQTVDRERGSALLGALLRAAQEKHIMLYFEDNNLQQLAETINLTGSQMPAQTHDYLMVADANLGSKSNHSIFRQLIYDVELESSGTLASRLTVAYDFPATVAAEDPAVKPEHYNTLDYYNLLQVFVPVGSVLKDWDNLMDEPTVVDTATHTIFVGNTAVEYNTGERFQFSYTSPPGVTRVADLGPYRHYRLALQKQPGMLAEPVTVQVSLPADAQLINAVPEPVATYSFERPVLEFRLNLLTDQWIDVIYAE
ncbi:DUF4012 domain-containing protein [Chloroflexota bacterium]